MPFNLSAVKALVILENGPGISVTMTEEFVEACKNPGKLVASVNPSGLSRPTRVPRMAMGLAIAPAVKDASIIVNETTLTARQALVDITFSPCATSTAEPDSNSPTGPAGLLWLRIQVP